MHVSVIVPVLNGEAFIAQALRSVLNQTLKPHEVIVVDNGSDDRTAEIARGFGDVVQVCQENRRGASAARATGAGRASGDALMFLDADDLLGPTVLEALSTALDGRPGSVACCPWGRYELVGGCWITAPASCRPRRRSEDPLSAWLTGWYHPPCSVLWSRPALDASGGWDPEITVNDDGDVMMRALAAGVPLVVAAGGTAYYRRLPGGAVSLSGQRFTPQGLQSRLTVLERVERKLVEAGTIERHRAAVSDAFFAVARDCGDAGDLRVRAEEGARRNRGLLHTRMLRRLSPAAPTSSRGDQISVDARVPQARPASDRSHPSGDRPLVSVIIPTFNRAPLLARALDSALAQTYETLEVLVIDDSSTDDTEEMVATRDDPRIRYLRQPENRGVAAARNRGLREARGALFAFLDSDDEWTPEKLARQVDLARVRPDEVGLIYSGVVVCGTDGSVADRLPDARGDVFAHMLHRNVVTASTVVVRRDVIDTVGLFDETLPANEDHDLWTRIARFYQFDFVSEPLTYYRNDGEESSRVSKNFAANMQARRSFLDRFGEDAARLGVKHLYHLDCARRHLESPVGIPKAARLHLLKALRSRPGEPRIAAWLAFSLIPRRPRNAMAPALKSLRTRLPRRLWFGSEQAG